MGERSWNRAGVPCQPLPDRGGGPQHFLQTAVRAGVPTALVRTALAQLADQVEPALIALEAKLPADFPPALHETVAGATRQRALLLESGLRSG